jgi:hypothetical protein
VHLHIDPDARWYLEKKLSWAPDLHDELTGTADLITVSSEALTVWDYKHGSGVFVEAENNSQAMLYLIAAVLEYGRRKKLYTGILQPRMRNLKRVLVRREDLERFEDEAREAAKKNLSGDSQRTAGEHCAKFCNAARTCEAYAKFSLRAAGAEFLDQPF